MTKQVKTTPAIEQVALVKNGNLPETTTTTTVTTAPAAGANDHSKNNLFVSVKTFDHEGRTIGERIVDMYHFGTRNWLQNHHWWAMHNGHCVEVNVATEDEIGAHLNSAKLALAAKFNKTEAVAA